ncbi:outer membrane protein, multidrug efflux system [Fodinibius roseus]|uniref:Outer membrane protein, multidrug efflux system n=1 Tax=Fodinibius roseus TaxID=1194090 RepID=A0A1M5FIS2_9BACT|nr:efflux transporter outer membrane subunit [Fodinibius roseus]SHF91368.1 outer membrane protein, multidrug efflux system [Fodinibius roseus]
MKIRSKNHWVYHIILGAVLTASAVSCSIRNYQKPPSPIAEQPSERDESKKFEAAEPVAYWWSRFGDNDLDSLVSEALDHNLDIAVAVANVRQTRAHLRESGFELFPVVRAEGGYSWQRQSEETGVSLSDRNMESYDVGLSASWELDLFGRVSQRKEAAKATYQASFAELRGAYVSVASEVALTYMQLRGAQYRLDVARRNVKNQEETYTLSKQLEEHGSGSELDVARAEAQLELTQSTIPPLKAQVKETLNRLSVLTGQPPRTLDSLLQQEKALPSLPPSIAVGDAAQMLRRRPDVKQAERLLAASVAQYNVQAADYFPRISILGSLGFVATTFGDLFSGGALSATVGPSISWAAFDLGRVDARVDAVDAEADARVAIYRRTVLEALEEVSTAMSDFSREEERRRRLTTAARASAKAARLARQRYEAGIDSFLDVLDAERRLLQAQDQLAISDIKVATDLIAIYRSLGGGWQVKTEAYAENTQ